MSMELATRLCKLRTTTARARLLCPSVAKQQVQTVVEEAPLVWPAPDVQTGKDDVYIGKGTFIKDDASKYPNKDGLGVGGWAGGEAGLQRFLDEFPPSASEEAPKAAQPDDASTSGQPAKIRDVELDGDELVYVGKGEFVRDDPRKYPSKDSAGFLPGATGGFAGGEVGVKQFVESGFLTFADEADARKRRQLKDAAFVSLALGTLGVPSYLLVRSGWLELPELPGSAGAAAAPTDATDVVSTLRTLPSSALPSSLPALPSLDATSVSSAFGISEEVLAFSELVAASAGLALLLLAAKNGVEDMSPRMWKAATRGAVRAALLIAVAAFAYEVVLEL